MQVQVRRPTVAGADQTLMGPARFIDANFNVIRLDLQATEAAGRLAFPPANGNAEEMRW